MLAIVAAICSAAPHTNEPTPQQAKRALSLAKALLAASDESGDEPIEGASAPEQGPQAPRTIASSMLQKELEEARGIVTTRDVTIDQLTEALQTANGELADVRRTLEVANERLAELTAGDDPKPPKKKG
jgi:hypothetical protein